MEARIDYHPAPGCRTKEPHLTIEPGAQVKDRMDFIDSIMYMMEEMYYHLCPLEAKRVFHCQKGENKGEWGYYVTKNVGALYLLMDYLKINSLVDLGAGAGLTLRGLKIMKRDLRVAGVEKEPSMVKIGNEGLHVDIRGGNILNVKQCFLGEFQAVYFWDPLTHTSPHIKKFIKVLETEMIPRQIVIAKSAGAICPHLKKSPHFTFKYYYRDFEVYQHN